MIKQREYLKRLAETGKIAHAYLFSGQDQVEIKKAALKWALFLLRQEKLSQVNPDLILVGPEENEIKISQIRELIWKLSFKPYLAPFKVAVIDQAQTMNQEAQNCFLKTLEEPAKNTVLILLSSSQELLLPTIVSRCQQIKFWQLPQKEMPKEIVAELERVLKSDLAQKFQLAKDLSEKENIAETLETWLYYFRKSLFSNPKAKNILSQILTANFLLSTTNANSRLVLENLMLAF